MRIIYMMVQVNRHMKNETFMVALHDLIMHLDNSIKLQNDEAQFYKGLIEKGFIFNKRVNKGATSGLICVPIAFAGKIYRVILIPIEDDTYIPFGKRTKSMRKQREEFKQEIKKDMPDRKPLIYDLTEEDKGRI